MAAPISQLKFLYDLKLDSMVRLRHHAKAQQLSDRVLAELDHEIFRERFVRFWNPFPGASWAKYTNIEIWMPENAMRFYLSQMDRQQLPADILDLGCGSGYFMRVCNHMGHRTLGLDQGGIPLYDEMIDFLGLERVIHSIQPNQPLPDFGRKFDVVTGFQTCFNFLPNGDPWSPEHWRFFLNDIRQYLKPGGRLFFQFNYMKNCHKSLPPEVKGMIRSIAGFKSRLYFIYGSFESIGA